MYQTEGPTGEFAQSGLIPHLLGLKGPSGYGSNSTAGQVVKGWQGEGKVVIITGCNTGLRKEAARALAAQGAEIIMAVRNTQLGEAAATDIRSKHPEAKLVVMSCDLASLASVKKFANDFKQTGKPCHVLMCNAGVVCPFMKTADGHEMMFGTNHLGHFLLVKELLPVLSSTGAQSGDNSRVVVLSSASHFQPYKPKQGGPIRFDKIDSKEGFKTLGAYGQSKLCNVLFARELHRKLTEEKAPVTAVVCHPGAIITELGRHLEKSLNPAIKWLLLFIFAWAFKSVSQGAATQVYLATSPDIKGATQWRVLCRLQPQPINRCFT